MKVNLSSLKIIDFVVINFNFKYEPISKESVNLNELFESYNIEMDYAIDRQGDMIRIFFKVGVNEDITPAIEGYHIFAECISMFVIDEKPNQTEEVKKAEESFFVFNSAIPMAINSLRAYILSFTASAPLGKYILPSIDIQEFYLRKEKKHKRLQKSSKLNSKKLDK